jgi:hypothetical protein
MAALQAKKCFFPVSRWVYALILTCDDRVAVWFKRRGVPGVCCLYPNSNPRLYDLAVVYFSAGKFVHQLLFRKMAYTIVQPPTLPCGGCSVLTDCCPSDPVSTSLFATFSNGTGDCTCLNGLSVPITYDPHDQKWKATHISACSVSNMSVTLHCASGVGWELTLGGCASDLIVRTGTCSPFLLSYPGVAITGCCTGQVDVTITP